MTVEIQSRRPVSVKYIQDETCELRRKKRCAMAVESRVGGQYRLINIKGEDDRAKRNIPWQLRVEQKASGNKIRLYIWQKTTEKECAMTVGNRIEGQ